MILQELRKKIIGELAKGGIVRVVQADFLEDSEVAVQMVKPTATLAALIQLGNGGPMTVRTAILAAGPQEDGTANTGNVYIGGPGTDVANGYPMVPGERLTLAGVDLSKIWVRFVTSTDRLRIFYAS